MNHPAGFFARILTALCLLFTWGIAFGAAYEAPLPAELSTDPDMCKYLPCKDVMPGADSFSPRMGKPAYVEAYRSKHGEHGKTEDHDRKDEDKKDRGKKNADREDDDRTLIGYVFLSTDIVDIPAYSGKPVVTLIGMDTKGIITGVRVLRHSEPILLLGIPESELTRFVMQYLGKFVGDKIEVGAGRPDEGVIGLDAMIGDRALLADPEEDVARVEIEYLLHLLARERLHVRLDGVHAHLLGGDPILEETGEIFVRLPVFVGVIEPKLFPPFELDDA